uniref:Ig-like domain-containing protein n=1 Tax=Labrus bergylta TaxID=56723 RepID=A0A3Q3F6A7_9LABR
MKNHVSYPSTTTVQKSFWFTKVQDGEPVDLQTDSQYTGRVTYSCKSKDCTLTITNVGNSDSAVYKFRFITNHKDGSYTGDPGVTLSLTVSPSAEIVENSTVTLTCSSDANPAANYTWYKENNNQPLSREAQLVFSSIKSSDSGEYFCKQQKDDLSGSVFTLTTNPPKLPSVSVSPSAEIVEGSSVTLTCSSDANPAANYTWFKEDEDSPTASGQIFNINNTSPEHSGHYICIAQNTRGRHNSTVHLTVLEGKLHPHSTGVRASSFPLPRASANRVPSDPVPVLPSNSAPVLPNDQPPCSQEPETTQCPRTSANCVQTSANLCPEPQPTCVPEPQPTCAPEPQPTCAPEPQPTCVPEPQPTCAPEPQPTCAQNLSQPVPEPQPVLLSCQSIFSSSPLNFLLRPGSPLACLSIAVSQWEACQQLHPCCRPCPLFWACQWPGLYLPMFLR